MVTVMGNEAMLEAQSMKTKISRRGMTLAILPGVLLLVLYYSLAVHMYRSLGGWPAAIGEQGFPPSLVWHAEVTMWFFVGLIWTLLVWPVAMGVCLLVKRWRGLAVYGAVYAGAVVLCVVLTTMAAPEQFLTWWRD